MKTTAIAGVACTLLAAFVGCDAAAQPEQIVLYSGRSKSLVQPIIRQFEQETGIRVLVKYGGTPQLAAALQEEGSRSPADLYWAQDAGGLGAVTKAQLFDRLPSEITSRVPPAFQNKSGLWVAVSGRARVLAYSNQRVESSDLPAGVFDLTHPQWKGRIGWAPANGSFQAFVTAMRASVGDEETSQWLQAMQSHGARAYPNNTSLVQAIAAEEIDLALTNHYYLIQFKADDENFPVEQTFFQSGDVGNLVNVAGIGRLQTSRNPDAADRFIEYLLSEDAQQYFAREVFEYPVTDTAVSTPGLTSHEQLVEQSPNITLDDLDDLETTLKLFRQIGLQ